MAAMRDIKRRIRSIKNTQQITKAMKMVSAAKLRRAQDKVTQARPYAKIMQESLSRIVAAAKEATHPLMEEREVNKTCYIVVTADRGLAGGFNANLIRMANQQIKGRQDVGVLTIGRKGRDFFKRVGAPIEAEYTGLGEEIGYGVAQDIARKVIALYTEGTYDRVELVFSEFVSALTQRPTQLQLLPVPRPAAQEEDKGQQAQYIFEPGPEEVLADLLPRYVETQIYRALLESKAGFYGAQMTAMDSASKNAKEMIDKLTLSLNRARQAAITKEISEIVGGAAALG